MTAIAINTGIGRVLLINTYNDIGQQHGLTCSIQALHESQWVGESEGRTEQTIWVGDFNLHHPLWDKGRNGHLFTRGNLERSQVLIDMMEEFDLQMALPKDIPTLQALVTGNHTRLDNAFISSQIAGYITKCTTLPEERPVRSDHIPVMTEIDILLEKREELPCPNFRTADWKEVRERLTDRLEGLDAREEIVTPGKLHAQVRALTQTISEVIKECIPKAGSLPYKKQWWSPLLTEKCMELQRLSCRAYNRRTKPQGTQFTSSTGLRGEHMGH